IARARALPIRRLEAEVSASAPATDPRAAGEDPLPRVRVTVHCTPAVRERWCLAHELAERVAGQRLRAEEALEWVTAEACSSVAIVAGTELAPVLEPAEDAARRGTTAADADCTEDAAPDAAPLPAPDLPVLAPLLDGLEDADAFELDRRLRLAVRLEQTLDAAIAPRLRIATSARYEWSVTYRTLEHVAAERLGMSASKARALLRIERTGDVCPELREAFRAGRLSWAK